MAPQQQKQQRRRAARDGLCLAAATTCGLKLAEPWFPSSTTSDAFLAPRADAGVVSHLPDARPVLAESLGQPRSPPFRAAATVTEGGMAWGVASALAAAGLGAATVSKARAKQQPAVVARSVATATEQEVTVDTGDLVKKTSVLVLGSTGTLGRQVVRQFLNAGYSVKCVVRNKADRPFSFLLDWGATVVEGSLTRLDSLPSSLIGIHTVIDCSTARPEESVYDIDWEGKKAFIQCCEKMQIQRYVFVSIKDCDKFEVPLMQVKYLTEKFLKKTKLRHTILRLSGFMQPLISQYAVNVLDEQQVWGDDGSSPGIAYLDSNDCARMIASAALKERTIGKTLTLTGPKTWKSGEVIKLCENLSGREAMVNNVDTNVLKLTQAAASGFEWSIDIAERLRFVDLTNQAVNEKVMDKETYDILGMNPDQTKNLDDYIGEYYKRVFQMLTEGKYVPAEGEVEQEKADEESKLKTAMQIPADDALPPGEPEEKEVSLSAQRDMSDRLQMLFEDRVLDELESDAFQWVGMVPIAEDVNGRAAMLGFFLGVFTEWATGVTVPRQIDQLIGIFSAPSWS